MALKKGAEPKKPRLTRSALTAARLVATRASRENSRRMISKPKNRPVRGALKVAAIPPAAPQATMTRNRVSETRTAWPRLEARAEPIWTMGPSRPTEPPVPMHSAEARALTRATGGRMRPPFSATATMTSGTPWPRASGAKRWRSGPYRRPPMTGTTSTK